MLHVAVEQGNIGVVEQLIAAGADVHALGADGATLLVSLSPSLSLSLLLCASVPLSVPLSPCPVCVCLSTAL